MKKNEIQVGSHYVAKVSGKLTTVRVDSMGLGGFGRRQHTTYAVTNLTTGRKTMFRSAAKFRSEVKPTPGKNTDALRERGYSDAELLDMERNHGPADPRDGSGVEGPQDDREQLTPEMLDETFNRR